MQDPFRVQIVNYPAYFLKKLASLVFLGKLVLLNPMEKVRPLDILEDQLDLRGVLKDIN